MQKKTYRAHVPTKSFLCQNFGYRIFIGAVQIFTRTCPENGLRLHVFLNGSEVLAERNRQVHGDDFQWWKATLITSCVPTKSFYAKMLDFLDLVLQPQQKEIRFSFGHGRGERYKISWKEETRSYSNSYSNSLCGSTSYSCCPWLIITTRCFET